MLRNREIVNLIFIYAAVCVTAVFLCLQINALSACVCGGALIFSGAAFFFFTRRRYKKIAEMSDHIRKMSARGLAYDIRDNTEGELSILKNDIHKLSARLSEQAIQLEKEKAGLKDVLFDISHQLKTPITSMTVMADLLEREELPPEKRREFINNIQTGLSRMDWLVKSLLKMARLDADDDLLKPERVSLREMANRAIGPVSTLMDIKNQRLEIDIGESLSAVCDINWTAEALANIIKNAAEHTPEEGLITVCAGENPICVFISVRDCGGGIDSADLPHLFKRFYKARGTGKDGAGIGLSMSLAIMRKQNGDIEVKNEKAGSDFTMKFYK